jgi:hypothetical protein
MPPKASLTHLEYLGPVNPASAAQPQAPLTPETARSIALSAWHAPGRLRISDHCKKRMRERGFDILDFEVVVKHGRPVGPAIKCGAPHHNYKYCFSTLVDGERLEASFAVDPSQDYQQAPLVVLITGVWKTKTGTKRA